MQVLISDGETGLDDPAATQYFELKGITKRTSAPGQHVRIRDRRTQVLRDRQWSADKVGTARVEARPND